MNGSLIAADDAEQPKELNVRRPRDCIVLSLDTISPHVMDHLPIADGDWIEIHRGEKERMVSRRSLLTHVFLRACTSPNRNQKSTF
jgi:hypothetical protein